MKYTLRLDLDGIVMSMRINGYNKHYKDGDDWLKVDFSLESHKWLNYQISSDIIQCCEVDSFIDALSNLLTDRIEKESYFELTEPDLAFILKPRFDVRENENVLYVRKGFEIIDISMTMEVHFWDNEGTLTANYMSLDFDRDNIECLLHYLKLVSGRENVDDESIVKLIEEGIVLPEYKL